MVEFTLNNNSSKKIRILCLGAHCDDIEIGCGGTLINILNGVRNVEVHWIVFSSDLQRKKEAVISAKTFLNYANVAKIKIENFRNGFFPYIGVELKEYFENIKNNISPDVIFTHYRFDLHQDHRAVSELTWNTFRNSLILEYEIPKYDGDFGSPNMFMPLEFRVCKNKIKNILTSFKTQGDKHWFTEDLFLSTLRIRGMECGSMTKYAEAFYGRKIVLKI